MSVLQISALCTGIVVMYLIIRFITRFKTFSTNGLGTVILLLSGGTGITYIDIEKTAIPFYPIGLFVGLVLYFVLTKLIRDKDIRVLFRTNSSKIEDDQQNKSS